MSNVAVKYFCYGNIPRKLTFERIGQTSVHGIPVQKFSLSDLVFDNGTKCKVDISKILFLMIFLIFALIYYRTTSVTRTTCPREFRMCPNVR